MSAHNAERRLLLSEDDDHQVWLDLETGEQVEVPVEREDAEPEPREDPPPPAFESLGPLMTVVREALDVFGVRYESFSPEEAEIVVEHHTLVSRMIMTVDEEDRTIRVLSQLPLKVPEGRRNEACKAAMRLMCRTTRTTILLNHESGRVQVSHLLMAADVEPTPGWVRHHVLSVYFAVDTVFAVLSAVANGLADGQDAEELASEIVARRDA